MLPQPGPSCPYGTLSFILGRGFRSRARCRSCIISFNVPNGVAIGNQLGCCEAPLLGFEYFVRLHLSRTGGPTTRFVPPSGRLNFRAGRLIFATYCECPLAKLTTDFPIPRLRSTPHHDPPLPSNFWDVGGVQRAGTSLPAPKVTVSPDLRCYSVRSVLHLPHMAL